ncbi:MAG: sugar phosphate isomerase/epimerase family protein [Terriglobales bacterium]
MRKAISTYVFIKSRLHPGMLDKLVSAGAEAIEIFGARGHFDYSDKGQVREIANWSRHNNVPINSIHSPMFSDYEWGRTGSPPVNIVDPDKSRRIASMDEIKRALEVAELAPFKFLIQHLGTPGEQFEPRKLDFGLSSLEHLHTFAKPLGVRLLLENIPNEIATPERLLEFINTLKLDLGICFDFGHANVMSSVPEALEKLKDEVRSTHVHDNNKDRDAHMFPGEGSIDWAEALAILRTAKHVPPLVLEINGEGHKQIVDKYHTAFRKLEEAAAAAANG